MFLSRRDYRVMKDSFIENLFIKDSTVFESIVFVEDSYYRVAKSYNCKDSDVFEDFCEKMGEEIDKILDLIEEESYEIDYISTVEEDFLRELQYFVDREIPEKPERAVFDFTEFLVFNYLSLLELLRIAREENSIERVS